MSSTSFNAAKIHVYNLRFSVDLDLDIDIQPQKRDSVQIMVDDRPAIMQAAGAVIEGAFNALELFNGALWGRQERARSRGTVLTYPGPTKPPKVALRTAWGSPAHALFAGEFDRMIGGLMEITPVGQYKFDMEVRIGDHRQRLLGCFVTDYPQQEGYTAIIPLSIDLAYNTYPEP